MQTEELMFNSNIGVIRDIEIVMDFRMLSNVDRDYRWSVKDTHIFIECKHHTSKIYKSIIIEFTGTGLIVIHGVDLSGNDLGSKIFNIDWYGAGAEPAFRQFLLNNYQYYLS